MNTKRARKSESADLPELSDIGFLVAVLVRALVDRPDEVEVQEHAGLRTTIIEVRVAPSDHGKLIGRRGRTANAIRELLVDLSGKRRHRYLIEILD